MLTNQLGDASQGHTTYNVLGQALWPGNKQYFIVVMQLAMLHIMSYIWDIHMYVIESGMHVSMSQ